jgi:lipopolysaccharide export system permease protein
MILRSYLVKEQIAPFLFSFSVIMFLLVLDTILQQIDMILGHGVSWEVATELFFLHVAWQVALAIPMSVLAGSLMAFGRLSGDNEIVAMRTLGVSVFGLMLPPLLSGLVLAGLLVVFNDQILPDFNHRARLLTMDIKRKRPTVAFQDRAGILINDFRDYHILIGAIDEASGLKDVLIYKYEPTGYPLTLTAREGTIEFANASDEVFLTLIDGEVHRLDELNPDVFVAGEFKKLRLRLGDGGRHLSRTVSGYRNDREMSIGMMLDRVNDYESTADSLRTSAARTFGSFAERVVFGESGIRGGGEKQGRGDLLDLRRVSGRSSSNITLAGHKLRQAGRLRVEIHKKLSIPAACVVFVMVGAPLGIRVRRGGAATGAALSIGFFLIYWVFLISGEKLADRAVIAPWVAMWSPNILLALVGFALMLGLVRRSR